MREGIVIRGIGGFYYVQIQNEVIQTKPRGIFRKEGVIVVPGDRVRISCPNEGDPAIEEIVERKNILKRPAVANMDQVLVVVSTTSPQADLMLLDKILVMAKQQDIEPIICINKIDIENQAVSKSIQNAYEAAGFQVVLMSAKTAQGFEVFQSILSNKISCLAGQSGVGKSTILNTFLGVQKMDTGSLSKKIERGKHTTRHVELVALEHGGYMVDTPGFTRLEIEDIPLELLQFYYAEFRPHQEQCKFSSCSHINEPQCGVKRELEQGRIDKGRYARYCTLYRDIVDAKKRQYKR